MQSHKFPDFPAECILLEFSEKQQTFHFNNVRKGQPEVRPNSHGFSVVYICLDHNEAFLIAEYIDKVIKSKKSDNHMLTTKNVIRHIKAIVKFSKSYNRLMNKRLAEKVA